MYILHVNVAPWLLVADCWVSSVKAPSTGVAPSWITLFNAPYEALYIIYVNLVPSLLADVHVGFHAIFVSSWDATTSLSNTLCKFTPLAITVELAAK